MKKQIITALVATIATLNLAATAFAAEPVTIATPWDQVVARELAASPSHWPEPGSTMTISLAPVAAKDHRGTEFEKGYRAALGMEMPFYVPGVSIYNELSYLTADRLGVKGDISMTTASFGLRTSLLPFATTISPFAQAGLGLGYIDQSGTKGGNDWRPVYSVGAGLASYIDKYRIDLGWQLDTAHVTGGTFGAHTFSLTTHIPLGN